MQTSASSPPPAYPSLRGFITSDAFLDAIYRSGARQQLRQVIDSADPDDPASLTACAQRAQELVRGTPVPDHLAEAVVAAYHRLGSGTRVAVRSSGTCEDSAGHLVRRDERHLHQSWSGDQDLLARVGECWASLYGERVIAYRANGSATSRRLRWSSRRWWLPSAPA